MTGLLLKAIVLSKSQPPRHHLVIPMMMCSLQIFVSMADVLMLHAAWMLAQDNMASNFSTCYVLDHRVAVICNNDPNGYALALKSVISLSF